MPSGLSTITGPASSTVWCTSLTVTSTAVGATAGHTRLVVMNPSTVPVDD